MDKAQFYWAVIGDANPEPVVVTVENGKRVAYTIGCPDPFDMDSGNIELIPTSYMDWSMGQVEPLEVPQKPTERQAERDAADKRLATAERRGWSHGWKRWNP